MASAPRVQRKATGHVPPMPQATASNGIEGTGEKLPHGERIQQSFGHHDVSDVQAYQGQAAKQAAAALGADAYASGRKVAFASPPDLRTAAHEAAHTVQQTRGVQLKDGIDDGAVDPYERHADEVAEAVVAGRSAELLLDQLAGAGASASRAVQRNPKPGAKATQTGAPIPARGDYLVERTADGSYVFVFNTSDRNGWSDPVLTGLRYYMQQVFPGVDDGVIRTVFSELKVKFDHHDASALPDDRRYELQIDVRLHRNVIAWMAAHHPEWSAHTPTLGAGGLHQADGGGDDGRGAHGLQPHAGKPHGAAITSDGKLGGMETGTQAGDVRTTRDGGIKDGSIYGEAGGDAQGWHHWVPKGQLQLQPTQPTYVAGSTVQAELAWDLSVHPEAGQILLPNHCTYAWTVHHGGKLIDSGGRSIVADDRRVPLRLGQEPGMYTIEVTATSKHFRAAHHRFSSRVAVHAVSEPAFDRAAFDETQLTGPDAAFTRDGQGTLHLRAGQTARTTQGEIGNLDLTRGGIDALAAQGKITGGDHDVATSQIDKQREALLEIHAKVKDGTPYVVRGTFVSREDSSTTPLRLMMHVLRRAESGGIARYELLLHDTTFGDAVQHPGSSAWRLDHDVPAAVYRRLEGEALEEMAEHFHAHNDYPKGTIHLAAQRLASDAVWETTVDTDNGRKTAKKVLGTAVLIGGAAILIVPGGSVVAAGLMVVTSAAGAASVALEVEDRIAKEVTSSSTVGSRWTCSRSSRSRCRSAR